MSRLSLSCRWFALAIACVAWHGIARAQAPPSSIEIFLPNGGMPSHAIELNLTRSDGYVDTVLTDSRGLYQFRTPPNQTATYTVTIKSDRQTYDTTTVSFSIFRNSPARQFIFLKPLSPEAKPKPANPVLDVANSEINIPADAHDAYKRATALIAGGQFAKAIPELKQAIELYPRYVRAINDLGVAYMKLKRFSEAESIFRQAIELDKRFFHPRMNLGIVLNRQEKYKEALEVLKPLYEENRGVLELRLAYGQALGGAGEFAEAEKIYASTLATKTLDDAAKATLHFRLGVLLNREGRFREAVVELQEAIALDPDGANSHVQLAAALMQLQETAKAKIELLRAYKLAGPDVGIAQLLLGQIYYAEKQFSAAQKCFEQYLRDVPLATNRDLIAKAIAEIKAGRTQ